MAGLTTLEGRLNALQKRIEALEMRGGAVRFGAADIGVGQINEKHLPTNVISNGHLIDDTISSAKLGFRTINYASLGESYLTALNAHNTAGNVANTDLTSGITPPVGSTLVAVNVKIALLAGSDTNPVVGTNLHVIPKTASYAGLGIQLITVNTTKSTSYYQNGIIPVDANKKYTYNFTRAGADTDHYDLQIFEIGYLYQWD